MASILIIDDEDLFRTMLKDMLQGEGYVTFEASDGEEGIRVFRQTRPDLIITDIVMPDKEGIQTIREIRKEAPDTPIIAMSGGGFLKSTDYLTAAELFGAVRAFPKPFETAELIRTIQELLEPQSPAAN